MALFNPLQLLIFPFLFLVALPLAVCAGFTTILAFLVLFLRLFVVYFDVGLEALRHTLVGTSAHRRQLASQRSFSTSSLASSLATSPPSTPRSTSSRRRWNRRGSSTAGSGSVTPTANLAAGSGSFTPAPALGLERDFEGVGGWRFDNVDTDGDSDQQWYNLNSRLEVADRSGKHHFRSQSGGAVLAGTSGVGLYGSKNGTGSGAGLKLSTISSEGLRMTTSPNSSRSRSRTPTAGNRIGTGFTKIDGDDYFPPYEAKWGKKIYV